MQGAWRHRDRLRAAVRAALPEVQQKLPDGKHPRQRLLAGEALSKVVSRPPDRAGQALVHEIRSLVLTINDETKRFNAQQRFERRSAGA